MDKSRHEVAIGCLTISLLVSVCILTVGCGSGQEGQTNASGSASTGGPKTGIVTGDMVFSGDGVFMIVKLDDGGEVSVRKEETASTPSLIRGAKVELEPIKDSKHGEWKLIRVLTTGK